MLGRQLAKPRLDDAAVGAAKLAGLGAGVFPDWRAASRLGVQDCVMVSPDPRDAAVYDRYFAVFRESSIALAHTYHALYEISQEEQLTPRPGSA